MKILIILAHPRKSSFNHALAQRAQKTLVQAGHKVILHDLYAEKFPAVLPAREIDKSAKLPAIIQKHCQELSGADGLVVVHPNWWGQPPAILKGWIDRVIRPGVAYQFTAGDKGEGVPMGLLRARTAVIFNTANTSPAREQRVFGDPLATLWEKCILQFCGIKRVERRMFRVMVSSTALQRQAWLQAAAGMVLRAFPADQAPLEKKPGKKIRE